MAGEATIGPFLHCARGRWEAVASALINGDGYLYGLAREHGHWSVYRWRAGAPGTEPTKIHDRAYSRDYAEECARADAFELARRSA